MAEEETFASIRLGIGSPFFDAASKLSYTEKPMIGGVFSTIALRMGSMSSCPGWSPSRKIRRYVTVPAKWVRALA